MAGQINIGAAKIEVGPVGADGGMGNVLATLGLTAKDTIKFNNEKGTKTEFLVEETDLAIFTTKTAGAKSFNFQVANPDLDTLVKVFGGEKDEATNSWSAPATEPTITQSLKFTPKKGFGIEFPKVLLTATWTTDIGKDHLLGIDVECEVLQPDKEGLGPYKVFVVQ